MKCPNCGMDLNEKDNFCYHCGHKARANCSCWIKRGNYNCGKSKCPGYGLVIPQLQEEYYPRLIHGEITARTGIEKLIQKYAEPNPGSVLAVIGLKHPATAAVYDCLVKKHMNDFEGTYFNLLIRRNQVHNRESAPINQGAAFDSIPQTRKKQKKHKKKIGHK